MRRRIWYAGLLLWSLLFGLQTRAAGDSIDVSLLTCSPGTEAYSLYGHTGLRVRNHTQRLDVVFNYGVFDFRQPHFVWRFVLGECDYELAPIPYDLFMQTYADRGSSVIAQTLNLTTEEANRLFALLVFDSQPENRTYRYNFLSNNCTTRVCDRIEEAVSGKVRYKESGEHFTYRQLLHRYTQDYPWYETGIDMLLGAACDTLLSDRAARFLPEQLMRDFAFAQIFDEADNRRPLVADTRVLLREDENRPAAPSPFPVSPLLTGLALLLLLLLTAWAERHFRRMFWGVDMLLMTLQGVAGLLISFMFLFSGHPTVGTNWLIVVFNPLPLFCLPWVVRCAVRRKVCLYHYINFLWLSLFLAFMLWIPQDFPVLVPLLALSLLTRPVSYYLHYSRKTEVPNAEEKPKA